MTLPVFLNEPLTFQQRLAEELESWPMLDLATGGDTCAVPAEDAEAPAWRAGEGLVRGPEVAAADSCVRLLQVTAYAVASYNTTYLRTSKPFNPLLGETFDLREAGPTGGGFRHLGEQVAHHPPISAFHCQSLRAGAGGRPTFEYFGAIEPSTKFRGPRVEAIPHGWLTVQTSFGDIFQWHKVRCRRTLPPHSACAVLACSDAAAAAADHDVYEQHHRWHAEH